MSVNEEKRLNRVQYSKALVNRDGWYNVVSGLGTSKDRRTYSEIEWSPIDSRLCEKLYAGDEMAQKIAKIIPYDGTREGISWNMEQNSNAKEVSMYLDTEFDRLKVWPRITWAWTQARIYGGACIFISVDDGRKSLESPLKMERVRKINSLRVFDRFQLTVQQQDLDGDLSSPRYGEPIYYTYQPSSSFGDKDVDMVKIHHSRMIRLDGIPLPDRLYTQNGYWHDSIYSALFNAIRNYGTNLDNVSTIISDFNQPVYRIEGLTDALAMDEEALITKKLQIVDLMRSTARAIVLDKSDEFQNVSTNVAGGKELLELTIQRLVAGSDIPHTRLLGNSPTGLGATGKSELVNYYDSVKSMQSTTLREPLELLTDLIFSQSTAIAQPNDLRFEFNPLFQQDQEIEIKTRLNQAYIDEKYIGLGVYDPQEVADSRFATGSYRYETVLDPAKERAVPTAPPEMAGEQEEAEEDDVDLEENPE